MSCRSSQSVEESFRPLAVFTRTLRSRRPRPVVSARPPVDNRNPADVVGKAQLMFDLIHLALQTDSTRLVTLLLLGTSLVPPIQGVSLGHHDLSHHGQDPSKIAQLRTVELEKMRTFRAFLTKLKETREGDAALLDRFATDGGVSQLQERIAATEGPSASAA